MAKLILYNSEARRKLKAGMDLLSKSVCSTFGPRGRTVIIGTKYGKPQVTKDGLTVAKEISLPDNFENIGVELLKKVAVKTGNEAGDGTTTSILLAHEIIQGGLKNLVAGANPMDLKAGIDIAVSNVVDSLKKMSKTIESDKKELEFVASISANNDNYIGELIAKSFSKVGKNGLITIEEGKGKESTIEIKEGMQFARGYLSPYFVTDNLKMEAVLDKPYLLIHDKKISDINHLLPLLNECANNNASLLIIAENIEGSALSTLILNSLRRSLNIAAIKTPGFGDNRKEILEDIAAFSSGTLTSEEKGNSLKYATLASLGRIDKAIISKDSTALILNKKGKNERVKQRINLITSRLANNPKSYDKEKLNERLAKLSGSVAVIRVGAVTEIELKEKKERFDDALKSTRAALEEGVIPGGGVAYIRSIKKLNEINGLNPDQKTGVKLVKKALEMPLKRIVKNAGLEGSIIFQKILEGKNDFGFNALTLKYENLLSSGVIDSTKVVRIALQNAASVAGMFLTLECAIAEYQKHIN